MNKEVKLSYSNGLHIATLYSITPSCWQDEKPVRIEELKSNSFTNLFEQIIGKEWDVLMEKNI